MKYLPSTLLILFIFSCSSNNKQLNGNEHLDEIEFYKIVITPDDTINSGESLIVDINLNSSGLNNRQFSPKWACFGDTTEITQKQNGFEMLELLEIPSDSVLVRAIPITIILGNNENDIFQDTIVYYVTNLSNSSRTSGILDNNQKIGLWKFYFDNDKTKIKEISNWDKNIKNGKTEYYYKNGKVNRTGFYKNGQLDGEWKTFGTSGKLYSIDIYENGKFIEQKIMN